MTGVSEKDTQCVVGSGEGAFLSCGRTRSDQMGQNVKDGYNAI